MAGPSPLHAIESFGARHAAAAIIPYDGPIEAAGDAATPLPWASVTKLVTAYAVLRAIERGTVALDEPAGPPGSTVRHLLAHTSGLGFEGRQPVSAPERTRIYSNPGFDLLGGLLEERTGRPIAAVLREDVLEPLGMTSTELVDRPSQGIRGPLVELAAFARELTHPTLVTPAVLEEATRVAFPALAGVLPGVGRSDELDWGLGFELRGTKQPHWTGRDNSPATFGHFGGTGTFLWVDPVARVALACLTDRTFGPWALTAWPALSDSVLAAHRTGHPSMS